ncbi:hypothetical protein V7S43_011827 [Phytophthora oleae]|uniref:Uncharacterized protein n=1 Tax=Phytophthora oleae TaxID=2107226 RepID=A0ABD3F9B0_9STRA
MPDVPLADKYEGGEFFFVRECYAEYYSKVEALLVEEKKSCVTVTGTPGIGKSIFYAFFVDRFRKTHADWTIVASTYNKNTKIKKLALFEPGKQPEVHDLPTKSERREIMLRLRAGEMGAGKPNPVVEEKLLWLYDGSPEVERGLTVVFSSPNEWLRLSRNYRQTYYMPPWTLEELQLAASVLEYPFRDDEIESRFWNFGGVVRNCFLLDPAGIPVAIDELTKPIEATSDSKKLENLLVGTQNDDTHHRFLHYEPKGDGRQWDTKIVSDMVREKLAERLYSVIKGKMNKVEALLDGIPPAASLRGSIFEAHAHTKLKDANYLDARPLDGPNQSDNKRFKMQPSDEIDIFQGNAITAALLNGGPYHKPKEKNFASVDGFFFPKLPVGEVPSMNEKDKRILLFQMTVSKNHHVRASGIIYLLEKLGLLDLVKANPKRAALIFVHPAGEAKDFKRQQIHSSGTSPANR